MGKHHTKEKGDLGVLKAKIALHEQGFMILNPETEHSPFDLVGYKDGKFFRFQVKYRALVNGSIIIPSFTGWADKNGFHKKRYDLNEIDYFVAYCPDVDKCYFVSADDFNDKKSVTLRVVESKNNQAVGVKFAYNYEKLYWRIV